LAALDDSEEGGTDIRGFIAILFSLLVLSLDATAAERLRFWNLTGSTIKELHLAPAGTTDWGPNQCRNDPDGAVDADEHLSRRMRPRIPRIRYKILYLSILNSERIYSLGSCRHGSYARGGDIDRRAHDPFRAAERPKHGHDWL
jgi:hypothetical protein